MNTRIVNPLILLMFTAAAIVLAIGGCSDTTTPPESNSDAFDTDPFAAAADKGITVDQQDGRTPPAGQVTVDVFGEDLTLWPFTGAKLDGEPKDPVNLIFTGHCDPRQIRAALLGLDGDRSLLGLPDAYPFNQTWHDAIGGGVQSTWAEAGGWLGSAIQLTLGEYEPVRFHLRLFRVPGAGVTIGAAHFEVLIPGTTDHQVLSWTAAKELVVGDLSRSGLLNPASDLMPTIPITPEPGFREIIPPVYNELPPELLAIVGGPPPPVDDPVAIPNDGYAMVVRLVGAAPVAMDTYHKTTTATFGQFVPRPYCSDGPYDILWIEGPVDFVLDSYVDADDRFSYVSRYDGLLTVVPLDGATGQPVGLPFTAKVSGHQNGFMGDLNSKVYAFDRKLTREADGPQIEFVQLRIGERGLARYRGFTRCVDD